MGLTYASLEIENQFQRRRLNIKALVDTGAVFMSVPEHIALQLGFDTSEMSTREVTLADGKVKTVPMIGPLRVYFADRFCDLSALVLGDEPLLGAVPMEMMDLVVHPATQTLTINPANPYTPMAIMKGAR